VGAAVGMTVSAAATANVIDELPIEELIKAQAFGLGFDLVGITALGPVDSAAAFDDWLSRGYAGEMEYMPRTAEKRRDSRMPFPGATSAIVVALNYGGTSSSGAIARYARGDDYHEVMWEKLNALHEWIEERSGRNIPGKAYVDTGPILERDLARKAGLGWFGKNTNLINPRLGSCFFIGSLLMDLDLVADEPFDVDRCGSCTRCLEACPTQALVSPGVLDSTRCISYLTIEAKGEIPLDFRESLGGLINGCDNCQDVCPYNIKFAQALKEPAFALRAAIAGRDARQLARELLAMTQEEFRVRFRGSPMKRAKLRGLKRNAAVVLGNVGTTDDVDVLTRARDDEPDAMLREHTAWALGRLDGHSAPAR
jgi:epoxyqueuosine reductase